MRPAPLRATSRLAICLALVAPLGLGTSGCFVLDELNKGQEIMEQHAPSKKGEAAAEDESGVSISSLREKGAGTIGQLSEKLDEAMKKEPDPENVIVRCSLDGRVNYTRIYDCQSLGGEVVMR